MSCASQSNDLDNQVSSTYQPIGNFVDRSVHIGSFDGRVDGRANNVRRDINAMGILHLSDWEREEKRVVRLDG
jgi:hypothetical protein